MSKLVSTRKKGAVSSSSEVGGSVGVKRSFNECLLLQPSQCDAAGHTVSSSCGTYASGRCADERGTQWAPIKHQKDEFWFL